MRNLDYFSKITKYAKVPAFSELQIVRDENGNLIRETSDVEYILGSTYNDNATAMETIRQYLISNHSTSSSLDFSNLSNEEIMNLIPPRSINSITDAYQYSKFLDHNSSYIKKKVDEYETFMKQQSEQNKDSQ